MNGTADITALQAIGLARSVADHARARGARPIGAGTREVSQHIGAILADTVLQAGLNYRSVVQPRIQRIINEFPETHELVGVVEIVQTNLISNFLLWNHSEKIRRFAQLVTFLDTRDIRDTRQLGVWMRSNKHRKSLLEVRGIGPKSVDYLACLIGVDCVAVDRHVRAFVGEIGIDVRDYDLLKLVVSYAADLLDMRRRDFDAWIWSLMSARIA